MDVVQIIKELREELDRIDSLILALDMLQSGRRRGRPPKLLQQLRQARSVSIEAPTAARKKTGKRKRKAAVNGRRKSAKRKAAAANKPE